jgi:hypothetical protein
MLYREIIAVCSHIHTKHINALCEQKVFYHVTEAINTQGCALFPVKWLVSDELEGMNEALT